MIQFILLYHYFRFFQKFKSRRGFQRWREKKINAFWSDLSKRSPYYRDLKLESESFPVNALPEISRREYNESFDHLNTLGLKREEVIQFCLESEKIGNPNRLFHGLVVGLSTGTLHQRGAFVVTPREKTTYAATFVALTLPRSLFGKHRIAYFLKADNPIYSASKSRRMQFQYFNLALGVSAQLDRLEAVNPTLLFAPPSALRLLARAKESGRIRLPALERILSGAEALDPIDETRIQESFGIRPFQVYQCTEGFLAASCSAGAIHLNEGTVLFEKDYLDAEKTRFAPVITDFRRMGQPYVRYRMSDVLLDLSLEEKVKPCPCGSVLERIKAITGREVDLIRVAGKIVFHDEISQLLMPFRETFLDYQLVQESAAGFRLALSSTNASTAENLREKLASFITDRAGGMPVSIRIEPFRDSPPEIKLRRVQNQSPK